MPNGDGGGGFDFGGIFDALLSGLVALVQAIINFLVSLVGAIVNALNFLFGGEQAIFGYGFLHSEIILHWLKWLLSAIYHAILNKVLLHLWELYQKLQAFVMKLKAWLDKWHALARKYQVGAFRRIINLIQRARKILVVFRLLHLKFATKLDHWLAGIEGRLISLQYEHARKTNEIIGWLDVFINPRRLLSGTPFWRSVGRDLTAVFGAVQALGLGKVFPQLVRGGGTRPPMLHWDQWVGNFQDETLTGGGTTGEVQRSTLDLYARMRAELGT